MKPSVILLGSKPGAVAALEYLHSLGWDIVCVVTSGKQNHSWIPGKKLGKVAHDLGIPVLSKQDDIDKGIQVDFVISYMYRYLVKEEVCTLANKAALNFHPGPLPEFGGWAFYNIAILEDSKEYGCTCHYMDNGFDTGDLLQVNRFPINASMETAYSLERKTQLEMIRLFCDFCNLVESNKELPRITQDSHKMRYMTKENFDELKCISLDTDFDTIQRYARAFWFPPYDCAYINMGGKKVEIIPEIAKSGVAEFLHEHDLELLRQSRDQHHTNLVNKIN